MRIILALAVVCCSFQTAFALDQAKILKSQQAVVS